MQITEIKTTLLKSYEYPNGAWLLVCVRTASGIEGIGECFVPDRNGKGVLAARAVIEHSLKDVVVGENVLETSRIWERM